MRPFKTQRSVVVFRTGVGTLVALLAVALVGWLLIRLFSSRPSSDSMHYTPDISVHTRDEMAAVRAELVRFIFDAPALPRTRPEPEGDHLAVRLPNGFRSHLTVRTPAQPNSALVLYHTGHEGETFRDRAVIRRLLREGYVVWQLDMPLTGANEAPVAVDVPPIGRVSIRTHEQMAYLDDITPGSPLRYFIEPVVAAVNLAQDHGYQDVFMVGLSGGGWTTIVAAAADPRITASYPVAASVPLGLRFDRPRKNWGDWEQVLPELYRIASYEDLYILGAEGRAQSQVLNELDLCCFDEPRYVLYEAAVQDALRPVGGEFSVWWSRGEFIHRANPAAVRHIVADMQARRTAAEE